MDIPTFASSHLPNKTNSNTKLDCCVVILVLSHAMVLRVIYNFVTKRYSFLHRIHISSGSCLGSSFSFKDCPRGDWTGFDVSGHAFLLIHSIVHLIDMIEGIISSKERLPLAVDVGYSIYAVGLGLAWIGVLVRTCLNYHLYFMGFWEKGE